MRRSEAREIAFLLVFEKHFNDSPTDEIIAMAQEARGVKVNGFARRLFENTIANEEEIDKNIENKLKSWGKDRLSSVTLILLRLAVYEILFEDEIPVSVSINEANELAKKYATQDDMQFINGVLGAIAKEE